MNYPNPGFPPFGPGPGGPAPGLAAGPARPRPGRAGIWVGIALLVAAVVGPLIIALTIVIPAWDLDRRSVPADGALHGVVLPANADYAIYTANSEYLSQRDPACAAVDGAGAEVELRPLAGTTTVGGWKVLRRFDTGSGTVVVTCESPEGVRQNVEVGKYPRFGPMIGAIFGALALGGVLGLSGFLCVLVTAVRRSKA